MAVRRRGAVRERRAAAVRDAPLGGRAGRPVPRARRAARRGRRARAARVAVPTQLRDVPLHAAPRVEHVVLREQKHAVHQKTLVNVDFACRHDRHIEEHSSDPNERLDRHEEHAAAAESRRCRRLSDDAAARLSDARQGAERVPATARFQRLVRVAAREPDVGHGD